MYYIVRATQNNKKVNLIGFMSILDEQNYSPWSIEWRKITSNNDLFLTNFGFYFSFIVQALEYKWFVQDGPSDKLDISDIDSNFVKAILDRMETETNEKSIEMKLILNNYIQTQ